MSETSSTESRVASGIALIAAERQRQIDIEGRTPEHDTEHDDQQLAHAAVYYAAPDTYVRSVLWWPWELDAYKPSPDNRVRELVKAGALIAAEIDRLQTLDGAR